MSITLYWAPISQPSRALKSFLVETGIEHAEETCNLLTGGHKAPPFTDINPAGTVPFITYDGKMMNESHALMKYLCMKYPE